MDWAEVEVLCTSLQEENRRGYAFRNIEHFEEI
jgi:hypothetical protein